MTKTCMHDALFKGILLVCDMDGTLLNSSLEISPENIKASRYFTGKGGLFTVATGRIERSVEVYLDKLPINAPAVLYNGAVIYDFARGGVSWSSSLPDDVSEVVIKVKESFPDIGVEAYHDGGAYLLQQNDYTERHQAKEDYLTFIDIGIDIPKPWHKVIFTADPDRLKDVELFLKQQEGSFSTVYSEPYFLELLNQDVSKGHALKVLKKTLGIEGLKAIAVGDGPNDTELIAMADIGVAVGNAVKAVRDAASFCCCHHDEHAVAEVIRWIEKELTE